MKALAKDPLQWPTIYALSRSQKEDYPSQVKHGHLDLLGKPEEIAEELKGMEVEYVFFSVSWRFDQATPGGQAKENEALVSIRAR